MEEMNIYHAIEKSKERLNQNSKQALRQIKLAEYSCAAEPLVRFY